MIDFKDLTPETKYRSVGINTGATSLRLDIEAEPDSEDCECALKTDIAKKANMIGAVLFSYYRKEQIQTISKIINDIPIYISEPAKEKLLKDAADVYESIIGTTIFSHLIENLPTFRSGRIMMIGNIEVTPYLIEGSENDAHILHIYAKDESVLYLGDISTHGAVDVKTQKYIRENIVRFDRVICDREEFRVQDQPF